MTSTNQEGLVSTIIPVFNRQGMLVDAVRSVLEQTYRPIEIIVVDDGSTDETPRIAGQLAAAHPDLIHAVHISNSGPGLAREAGRRLANGEFIQYLDSDDLLLPTKFEVQVEALRQHPDCGIAYGGTRLVDAGGVVLEAPFKWTGRDMPTLFPLLLVDRWWNTHTPLIRRSVCDAVGAWSDMRVSEDWEYDARIGALGTRLCRCPGLFSDTREHPGSRLAAGPMTRAKIRDICRLNKSLFECACTAAVALDSPEMRHFARSAFLTARQAGSAGLAEEARVAFELALSATELSCRKRPALRIYGYLASTVGWRLAGRVSQSLGGVIPRRPGPETLAKSTEHG